MACLVPPLPRPRPAQPPVQNGGGARPPGGTWRLPGPRRAEVTRRPRAPAGGCEMAAPGAAVTVTVTYSKGRGLPGGRRAGGMGAGGWSLEPRAGARARARGPPRPAASSLPSPSTWVARAAPTEKGLKKRGFPLFSVIYRCLPYRRGGAAPAGGCCGSGWQGLWWAARRVKAGAARGTLVLFPA